MKKRIISVCAIFALVVGGAMYVNALVVTDPGSYAHLIEQVRVANEQIAQAKKEYESIKKMKSNLEGSVRRVESLANSIDKLRKEGLSESRLESVFTKAGYLEKDILSYQDLEKELMAKYGDPKSKHYNRWVVEDFKSARKGEVYNHALVVATNNLKNIDKSLAEIQDLEKLVLDAETQKTSTDASNQLLLKISKTNVQILATLSRLVELRALEENLYHPDGQSVFSKAEIEDEARKEAVRKKRREAKRALQKRRLELIRDYASKHGTTPPKPGQYLIDNGMPVKFITQGKIDDIKTY